MSRIQNTASQTCWEFGLHHSAGHRGIRRLISHRLLTRSIALFLVSSQVSLLAIDNTSKTSPKVNLENASSEVPIKQNEGLRLIARDLRVYTRRARAGDADAAMRVWQHYEFVEKDYKKGAYWKARYDELTKTANKTSQKVEGDRVSTGSSEMRFVASAQPQLAVTTYDQLLAPRPNDENEARQGNIPALLRLATYYDVVRIDPKRAAAYYAEAASRGSTIAARALGDVYVSKESFDAAKAIAARMLMRRNVANDPLTVEPDALWARNAYDEAISNGISRRAAEPLLRFAETSR